MTRGENDAWLKALTATTACAAAAAIYYYMGKRGKFRYDGRAGEGGRTGFWYDVCWIVKIHADRMLGQKIHFISEDEFHSIKELNGPPRLYLKK